MAYDFQIVVDCANPHQLADWWALTLDWEVQPSDEDFIRKMVAQGFATEAETTTHNGVLVWRTGQAIRLTDAQPPRRILFQVVPEPKTVKNRVHLDVRVGAENIEAQVAELIERGATFQHRGQQGSHSWVTMTDPEGNEFCVA